MEQSAYDLVIIPSPFGHDFAEVGADSVGTVIDVLTARSTVALLVVRKVYEPEDRPFQRVALVPLDGDEATHQAAAWATGLVTPAGELELQLVLDAEVAKHVRELAQLMDPDATVTSQSLLDALTQSRMRLHCALEDVAEQVGFGYRLDVHSNEDYAPSALQRDEWLPLIVSGYDPGNQAPSRLREQLRQSPYPCLAAPFRAA